MRLRTSLGLAAAVSVGLVQHSSAFQRPKGAEAPIVSAEQGARTHRATAWSTTVIPGWTAIVDRDTDVPLRLWGAGPLVANAVTDGAVAEAAARQFLATHLATLAPGASIDNFELISNTLSDGVRSVGFTQRVRGMRVLGGAIGFSFKADRLVMVTSTALPNVIVATPRSRLATSALATRAQKWLADDGHAFTSAVSSFAPEEPVIMPIVRPRVGATPDITYRVAEPLTLQSTSGPGRWNVWMDATSGEPIARKSTIHYATGKILFDAGDRYPGGTRTAKPAAFASHTVNGAAVTSTADGSVTWAGTSNASVALTLSGPFVDITNQAGARLTETISLAPNGTYTWSRANDELADAQISAFVHANIAKQFAKTRMAPTMGWLDQPLAVYVNENSSCNAYSTGDDIHFYRRSNQCENTGRMADVVYHEFGHSLHAHAIIEGVGAFDGALSEGMSDMFAALITRDAGMGRGFFFTNSPLRNLDNAKRWPDDVTGEVHDDGEIIGAAMWHLGQRLETKLGAAAGHERTIKIVYGILQRATDIPSAYAEALVTDDDDGNLANGTPNMCEINAAFGQHGLADPSLTVGITPPTRDNFDVSLAIQASSASQCPGAPTVTGAKIEWRPRGGTGGDVVLAATGTTYAGSIPTQPDGTVVQYKVVVTLSDGSTVSFPKNVADPYYEFYVGEVTKIWCADFEDGIGQWTTGANVSTRNEWEVGAPMGLGGDPKAAFAGTNVLGVDLSDDGLYRPRTVMYAESPEIDLAGHTMVRLQYQRWLGVEDGFFDRAKIQANGVDVWKNFASFSEEAANKSHVDREWRFQDVDLSAQATTGKIKLRFELQSDEGLELAGWTVDDVCVVAMGGPALTCGNNTVDDGETCDDGNRTDGDGCDANCNTEGETQPGGCCSVGGGPQGALALSIFTLGVLLRRRRRT